MFKKFLPVVLLIAFAGCSEPTKNIDTRNDSGGAVMGLDYRDFDRAASEMVQSMIASGEFKKPDGGKYVVAKGRILNDTMQRIDTDQLMMKVEQEMTRSGLIVMTAAVSGTTSTRDSMVNDVRDLRDSEKGTEFKQDTMPDKGQLLGPELSISGKIIQRDIRYDNNKKQVEYYFQLQMNNLKSGLVYWQNEIVLGKRGSNKSVSW
jgi:penicillin-binding protein activator